MRTIGIYSVISVPFVIKPIRSDLEIRDIAKMPKLGYQNCGGCMKPLDVEAATFFVSPEGNDANTGSKSSPFATPVRARNAVREWMKENYGKGCTVLFREGTYWITETLEFGLQDSVPEDQYITYASYPGETAAFSAGVRVPARNWRKLDDEPSNLSDKARNHVWIADVPEAVTAGIPLLTMFEGPEILPRARGTSFNLVADDLGSDDEIRRDSMNVPSGVVESWPDIQSGEIVVIPKYPWTMNILPIKDYDAEARIVTTKLPHTYPMRPNPHIKENIWIENVLAVLDSPGEWVYDGKGRIYYWPRTGQPSDSIEYAGLTEILKIEGETAYDELVDTPVRGIRFSGITFTHTERYRWYGKTGWGIQHDWEAFDRPTAMVRFRGAEDCAMDACRFTCGSSAGVRLDLHSRRNAITGCLFDYLGGCGILLCGYGPGLKDVNRDNEISNNHIHHIGRSYWHSPAIFVWQSGDNRIAHNHVHHTCYTGIVVSGRMRWDRNGEMECSRTVRWKETALVVGEDYIQQTWHQAWYPDWKRRNPLYHGHGNVLEYNDIHHVMEILGDGNAIYISGTGTGNIVRYNAVHDCPSPTMRAAIRCDDDQHETTIHGNVMYRLGGSATGIAIKGINDITNNIIAYGTPERTRRAYISLEVGPLFGSKVQNNIICATRESHGLYYQGPRIHGEGPLPLLRDCEADSNVYWCLEDPSRCRKHLEVERRFGIEQNSRVSDPMFVDPENGDFRLKEGSPALELGFVEIDCSKIGPTGELRENYR
jgi:hypothetical protein